MSEQTKETKTFLLERKQKTNIIMNMLYTRVCPRINGDIEDPVRFVYDLNKNNLSLVIIPYY